MCELRASVQIAKSPSVSSRGVCRRGYNGEPVSVFRHSVQLVLMRARKRKSKKRAQLEAADGEEEDPKGELVQEQRRQLRGELRTTLDVLRREKAEMVRGDNAARKKTEALKEKQDTLFEKVRQKKGREGR